MQRVNVQATGGVYVAYIAVTTCTGYCPVHEDLAL